MSTLTDLYDSLADILSYPGRDYPGKVRRCGRILNQIRPQSAQDFRQFSDVVAARSAEELEELFTQTFDLNPACCLDMGWHLFGENYERGRVLVKMRQELARAGLQESGELPDHLTHVLRVLTRMEPARAAGLAVDGVLPAVNKMVDTLAGKDNPYEVVLRTIRAVVQESVPHEQEPCHG